MEDPNAPGGEFHTEVMDVLRSVASLYRPKGSYHIDGMALADRLAGGAQLMGILDRDSLDPLKEACFALERLQAGLAGWPETVTPVLSILHPSLEKALKDVRTRCVFQGEILGYLSGKALPVSELSARSDAIVRRYGGTPIDHQLYEVPTPSRSPG